MLRKFHPNRRHSAHHWTKASCNSVIESQPGIISMVFKNTPTARQEGRSGCRRRRHRHPSSDDVLEAVGGVAGQPRPLAAAAQVLAVRPLHVDVPLLPLAAARGLQASLDRYTQADVRARLQGICRFQQVKLKTC